MARTIKKGLDYFPLDVQVEDKIKLIEAKHGLKGFGLLIKLYQKIYSNGYYIEWEDKNALLFSNEVNVDINYLNDVINDCLSWNVFNKRLHEKYSILTSHGIQVRYKEATYRRKKVKMIEQFNLLAKDEMRDNIINVHINSINDNINSQADGINDNKNKQSKVKESKVKESNKPSDKSDTQTDEFSIKKLDNGRYDYPDEYERIYSLYPDNKGTKKSGWRKWAARRREGINQKDLVEAVKNYAKECKRENRDKKYIKHLATFLGPDDHWREYLLKNYTGAGEQNEFSKAGRKEKRENRERKQSKYDQDVVFG